jgi:hypothetical protein
LIKRDSISLHLPSSVGANLTPSHPTEFIYSAASHASIPNKESIFSNFHIFIKKSYWKYWLQVCTIRLPHACSFMDSYQVCSWCVIAYTSLSQASICETTVLTLDSIQAHVYITAEWLPSYTPKFITFHISCMATL